MSDTDKIAEIRTFIHTDDIQYIDTFEEMAYVTGNDRCGWRFAGFIELKDLPVLFP